MPMYRIALGTTQTNFFDMILELEAANPKEAKKEAEKDFSFDPSCFLTNSTDIKIEDILISELA